MVTLAWLKPTTPPQRENRGARVAESLALRAKSSPCGLQTAAHSTNETEKAS